MNNYFSTALLKCIHLNYLNVARTGLMNALKKQIKIRTRVNLKSLYSNQNYCKNSRNIKIHYLSKYSKFLGKDMQGRVSK